MFYPDGVGSRDLWRDWRGLAIPSKQATIQSIVSRELRAACHESLQLQ